VIVDSKLIARSPGSMKIERGTGRPHKKFLILGQQLLTFVEFITYFQMLEILAV
jgi:hypothetical protein